MNGVLLQSWVAWDYFYQRMMRFHSVNAAENNIFRIRMIPYCGMSMNTEDGTVIKNGDYICHLHLHNCLLVEQLKGIQDQNRLGLYTLKWVRASLPGLASSLYQHPLGPHIKAVTGITILHRGAAQLGFSVEELPNNVYNKMKNDALLWMLRICHPEGKKRLRQNPHKLKVRRLIMSTDTLYQKYGTWQVDGNEPKNTVSH